MKSHDENVEPMDFDEGSGEGYLIHLAEAELEKLDAGQPCERGAIDAVWKAAASDRLTLREMASWAKIIARRVFGSVIEKSQIPVREDGNVDERDRLALKALGLFGPKDQNYRERQHLELFLSFEDLVKPSEENRQSRRRKLLRIMRSGGFYADVPDADALKRVDRLLAEAGNKSRKVARTRDKSGP